MNIYKRISLFALGSVLTMAYQKYTIYNGRIVERSKIITIKLYEKPSF